MPKSSSVAEIPISQGRNGSSTTPTPASPAAAAKPSGRQHAMQESALTTAATGASFSLSFTIDRLLFGRRLEGADETAAAEADAPRLVQPFALVRVLQRVGRHHVVQLRQRRVEDVFVAAEVVGFGKAAGANLGQRAGREPRGAAVHVVVFDREVHRRG